jgi:hypothetical protein
MNPSEMIPSDNRSKPRKIHKTSEYHGLTYTPIYRRWAGMVARCRNVSHARYPYYGGRGIRVCERWENSITAFIEDMGYPPSPSHSIDRINCDGNYEPSNCKWATQSEQIKNRRPSAPIMMTARGMTKSLGGWAHYAGISRQVLYTRLRKNNGDIDTCLLLPQLCTTRQAAPSATRTRRRELFNANKSGQRK